MSWQTCPLEAITAVVGREPAFLGSKQQEAGHAALSVGLGRLTVAEAGAFASPARQAFEAEVMLAVGDSLDPYVRRLIRPQRHTQGTSQSVWTLCLLDTPAATLAKQAKLDAGYAQVDVGGRQLELPVFVGRAVLPADRTLVKVSNLPWEWQVEGLTQALLTSAGYGHTAAVHYEHAGALPSPFRGKPLWARGDVVIAAIKGPVQLATGSCGLFPLGLIPVRGGCTLASSPLLVHGVGLM